MPIIKQEWELVSKRSLTHDVFELVFRPASITPVKAGEYILFTLAPTVRRAYSIAYSDGNTFTFVIKRISEGMGSPILCDAPVGTRFEAMGPMGHFTLQETDSSKCFIGTGTGFAPLYFQMRKTSELFPKLPMAFVFWVREAKDLFYGTEIRELKELLPELNVTHYLSREDGEETTRGYVTDWITKENIAPYQEFYLCGSPAMVKDAKERLSALGVATASIFSEQF